MMINLEAQLELKRPLICIDLETTGTSPKADRICQVALVKLYPAGQREPGAWETLVNPQVPIPPECTIIHGITNEMVAGAPFFNSKEVAGILSTSFIGCDFAGFNILGFDIPMLKEEFKRCGIDPVKTFGDARFLDAFKIFQTYERRTLAAAAKFYLGEEHVDAHSAMGDVKMTLRVLGAQLERYEMPRDVGELHTLLFDTIKEGNVDPEGKIVLRGGVMVLNFSRHAGTLLEKVDDGFLRWALRQDFHPKVKEVFTEELRRRG